jgi:hypothetical protein
MANGAALPEELGGRNRVGGTNGSGGDIHQVLLAIDVDHAGRRRLGVKGD